MRLLHRIDDAAMAAGRDDDKAAVLHVEAGGMLVIVLIGNGLSHKFGRHVMRGVAAQPVGDAELLERVGKDFSSVRRLIWPVVKAWPPMTVGLSHSTTPTLRAASARRSR